jgi:Holliday junction resolvasome RuvABC endonuclease subunit
MKLGIRTSPTTVRYAIVDCDDGSPNFVNAHSENKLDFPQGKDRIEQKLHWLSQELERIFRLYPDIDGIAIKTNEYSRRAEKANNRNAAYFDGVVLAFAGKENIPVETKLYRSMDINRENVKSVVETKIGQSNKYWNEQMADAAAAALSLC